MDRDTAVAQIKQKLGFRTDLDTEAVATLQLVQAELEMRPFLPWWLESEWSTGATIANNRRVALPADFIREKESAHLYYKDSDGKEHKLIKDGYDRLELAYGQEEGAPERYALIGTYLYIFPIPDDAYSLRWLYYAKDTVLTSNIENKWLKYVPHLLIYEAAAQLAEDLGEANARVAAFRQKAAVAYVDMQRAHVGREVVNDEMIIEGDL